MPSYDWIILAAATPWVFFLCRSDWRERRLPNVLTLGGLAVVLAFRLGWGFSFFLDGIFGALLCGGFLLIPMLLHAAGAGDVKMLAACGAACGLGLSLYFLLATSLFGLLLVVVMLCARAADGARLKHYARVLFDWRYDRAEGRKT